MHHWCPNTGSGNRFSLHRSSWRANFRPSLAASFSNTDSLSQKVLIWYITCNKETYGFTETKKQKIAPKCVWHNRQKRAKYNYQKKHCLGNSSLLLFISFLIVTTLPGENCNHCNLGWIWTAVSVCRWNRTSLWFNSMENIHRQGPSRQLVRTFVPCHARCKESYTVHQN